MKIAVVDDQEIVCATFKAILAIENHVAECFGSAEEFIRCTHLDSFECLLLDFRLPGKNGIELVRYLRENSFETPAILISGNMDEEFQNTVFHFKNVATLRKPCTAQSILNGVTQFAVTVD